MDAAERLRDVAIPADWQMCAEGLLKILCGDIFPLDRAIFPAQKCWWMIVPVNLVKRLMAEHTFLSGVPLIDDGVHKARLGRLFDLRKAFLAAAFHLRPARTLAQSDVGLSYSGLKRGFRGGYIYGSGEMILRAGNDPLATELQIGTKSPINRDGCGDGNDCQNGDQEQFHGGHPFPGIVRPVTEEVLLHLTADGHAVP